MKRSPINLLLVTAGLFSVAINLHAAQLQITQNAKPVQLRISGEPGGNYVIEETSHPETANGWNLLLTLALQGSSQVWSDPASVLMPHRFYRIRSLAEPLPQPLANDFRLIDHLGASRELSYYSTQRAVVLIFTSSACADQQQIVTAIKALRSKFEAQGVLVWMIDSSADDSRAALTLRAATLGIDFPALHDRGQLVARSFGVSTVPQAVCIDTSDWSIFYQGAIDGTVALGTGPTQSFVESALSAFLSSGKISITRVEPSGCALDLETKPAISYERDIAPLLQNNCVRCHSVGNIAPWAMTNHAVVQSYARSIKTELLTGRMPPWHADPMYGAFTNDVSLQPRDASTLIQWIDAGAPRGNGADPLAELVAKQPPPKDYPYAWPAELGQPDFILSIPTQSISARGEVPYKYLMVTANIPSNAWLRAAAVLPGNARVVHHCLVFSGSFLEVILNAGGLGGYFAGYVPGIRPTPYPTGTGKLLPKNSTLTFQMHYTTTGKVETDQTRLGLYFYRQTPAMELQTRAAATADISISPRQKEYLREAQFTPSASNDIWLYEMGPHMHYRGARFKYEAFYPNGSVETLLSVPQYDFHWQTLYRLAQPKRLPAGTLIRCSGAFDNSPQNPDNPNPDASVSFGEQTDDEMFIGYFNYSIIP